MSDEDAEGAETHRYFIKNNQTGFRLVLDKNGRYISADRYDTDSGFVLNSVLITEIDHPSVEEVGLEDFRSFCLLASKSRSSSE